MFNAFVKSNSRYVRLKASHAAPTWAGRALQVIEQRQFLKEPLNLTTVDTQLERIVLKISEWIHGKGEVPAVQIPGQ